MLMKKMEIKTTMQKDYFKTFQELDFWLLRHCDQSKSNENKNTNKSTEQVQAANTIKYN